MTGAPWRRSQVRRTPSPASRSPWEVDLTEQPAQPAPQPPAPEQPAPTAVGRTKALVIRLSEEEREQLHAAARAAGAGKTATWARRLIFEHAGRGPEQPAAVSAGEQFWRRELSRIGSNLNQLTRAVNVSAKSGGVVGTEVADQVRRLVEETRRLRESIERSSS